MKFRPLPYLSNSISNLKTLKTIQKQSNMTSLSSSEKRKKKKKNNDEKKRKKNPAGDQIDKENEKRRRKIEFNERCDDLFRDASKFSNIAVIAVSSDGEVRSFSKLNNNNNNNNNSTDDSDSDSNSESDDDEVKEELDHGQEQAQIENVVKGEGEGRMWWESVNPGEYNSLEELRILVKTLKYEKKKLLMMSSSSSPSTKSLSLNVGCDDKNANIRVGSEVENDRIDDELSLSEANKSKEELASSVPVPSVGSEAENDRIDDELLSSEANKSKEELASSVTVPSGSGAIAVAKTDSGDGVGGSNGGVAKPEPEKAEEKSSVEAGHDIKSH